MCKYISKAGEKVGGRWYYSGGALRRPEVTFCDVDFVGLSGFRFRAEGIGCEIVKVMVEGGEKDEV